MDSEGLRHKFIYGTGDIAGPEIEQVFHVMPTTSRPVVALSGEEEARLRGEAIALDDGSMWGRTDMLALFATLDAARQATREAEGFFRESMGEQDKLRAQLAEARGKVKELHSLVAEARTYIDPDEHAQWEESSFKEIGACDARNDRLQAEREVADRHLGNLLARIHRDGGHRQDKIGTEEACIEADGIVSNCFAERDAARSDMASIADLLNGWCRDVGASESPDAHHSNVREALNRVGYCANLFRIGRDAALTQLAEARTMCHRLEAERDTLIQRIESLEGAAQINRGPGG
jgi:hypothetical protein